MKVRAVSPRGILSKCVCTGVLFGAYLDIPCPNRKTKKSNENLKSHEKSNYDRKIQNLPAHLASCLDNTQHLLNPTIIIRFITVATA